MCNCATKVDEHLKERNYMLARNMLEGDAAPVLVEIVKIESRKRTPSCSMVASYCLFCGKKYPRRKTRGRARNGSDQIPRLLN